MSGHRKDNWFSQAAISLILLLSIGGTINSCHEAHAQSANGKVTTAAPTYTNGAISPLSLDTAGNLRSTVAAIGGTVSVVGNVASGATDSGNPVKTGGIYNSTLPTFTNGQRGDFQIGTRGSQSVQLMNVDSNTALATQNTNADGIAVSSTNIQLRVAAPAYVFNGTTWDRLRGDTSGVTLGTGTNKVGQTGVAQGSTTSGQNGDLVQGAVTTNAPSYTNAQTSPISLDTSGNVRVNVTTEPTPISNMLVSGANFSTSAGVIKASAGQIYAITWNAVSASMVLDYYDNASACSGTKRLELRLDNTSVTATAGQMVFPFPIAFGTGITVCTSTGTVNGTTMYK